MKTLEKLGLGLSVIKKPEFSNLGVGLCMCTLGRHYQSCCSNSMVNKRWFMSVFLAWRCALIVEHLFSMAQGLEFDAQHCKIKQNVFVLSIYLVEKYKKGWEDSSVCKVLKHKHKDLSSDPPNRQLKVGWGYNITSLSSQPWGGRGGRLLEASERLAWVRSRSTERPHVHKQGGEYLGRQPMSVPGLTCTCADMHEHIHKKSALKRLCNTV